MFEWSARLRREHTRRVKLAHATDAPASKFAQELATLGPILDPQQNVAFAVGTWPVSQNDALYVFEFQIANALSEDPQWQ
jgi:hypothetical protein